MANLGFHANLWGGVTVNGRISCSSVGIGEKADKQPDAWFWAHLSFRGRHSLAGPLSPSPLTKRVVHVGLNTEIGDIYAN